jgi:carbonic anhydrase
MPARPDEALARLREGNARFTQGRSERDDKPIAEADAFATVLTCMDGRLAPEIVFDEGLGGFFVLRVGGNVAGEFELQAIEVTMELGVSLVVVLGHTDCKAVARAEAGGAGSLFDAIREQAASGDLVRDNVLGQADKIRHALPHVRVAAAVYDVATGAVTFLD